MDYNPHLKPKKAVETDGGGGKGFIESPDDMQFNISNQTRPSLPDEFENKLCDALQSLFMDDIVDLSGLVEGLNAKGVNALDGNKWTEASFQAEMLKHNDSEA